MSLQTSPHTQTWAIKLNGKIIVSNLASRYIAERTLATLNPNDIPLAEIVATTPDGKMVLLG